MNGVTIIEEHLCRVIALVPLLAFGIFFTIICIGGIILNRSYICESRNSNKWNRIIPFTCSIILVILCIGFWALEIIQYNKVHTEYTVTVEDSVSFNDFHAKYEIISIDGDKYRVVEK